MGSYSLDEIEALNEFRNALVSVDLSEKFSKDEWLIRWLRARDLNIKQAKEMLLTSLKFREESNHDDVLEWETPDIFIEKYASSVVGHDKDGSPVVVVPSGRWDLRYMVDKGNKEEYWRFINQGLEAGEYAVEENRKVVNPNASQVVFIMDFEKFSYWQVTSGTIDGMLQSAKRFDMNHPELLKAAYIVNAPKIFSIVFTLLKSILSSRTLGKIHMFGSNKAEWKKALLERISPDQLPHRFGGTKKVWLESFFQTGIISTDEPDDDTKGKQQVVIPPGEKYTVNFTVRHANSKISWSFKTERYDIGFSILNKDSGEIIVPYERIHAYIMLHKGDLIVKKSGNYSVIFDNSISLTRSKTLYFEVITSSNLS